jgi:cytochrome c oxidase subunit 3
MSDEATNTIPEQFESAAQREEADSLGIWTFLSTEILFFGGLILSYSVYRVSYHPGFVEGSAHLYFWIGTINTFILLTSSLFMALAVHSIQDGDREKLRRYLALTFTFGAAFLGLKLCEYYLDYREHLVPSVNFDPTHFLHPRSAELFLFLYFAMTGLHAIHMTLGLSALTYLYIRARRNDFSKAYHSPVRVVGLYWHFVDIVWVFLYPMLYLINN